MRLSKLSVLSGPNGCILDHTLPAKYLAMYETIASLPPIEHSFASVDLTEPGKRPWETSKSGYINWAVGRLLVKGEAGSSAVDKDENLASEVGSGEDLRQALHAIGDKIDTLVSQQRAGDRDEQAVDDDNRMEE